MDQVGRQSSGKYHGRGFKTKVCCFTNSLTGSASRGSNQCGSGGSDTNLLFPGRFFDSGKNISINNNSHRANHSTTNFSWFYHQQGKVVIDSSAGAGVSGSLVRPAVSSPLHTFRQGFEGVELAEGVSGKVLPFKKGSGAVGRILELHSKCLTTGETLSSSHHLLDECSHMLNSKRCVGSGRQGPEGSSSAMGEGGDAAGFNSHEYSSAFGGVDDRRVSPWLERRISPYRSQGGVGIYSSFSLHELEGAEGCSSDHPTFRGSVEGKVSKDFFRQHDCLSMSATSGVSQLSSFVVPVSGDSGSLPGVEDLLGASTHQGDFECPSGQGVQGLSQVDGMVPGSEFLCSGLQAPFSPSGGSFRDEGECPTANLRLSLSGQSSCGGGRFQSRLEPVGVDLSFSSPAPSSGGGCEVDVLSGRGVSGGSSVANHRLVLPSVTEVSEEVPSSSGSNSLTGHVPGSGFLPRGLSLEPVRLDVMKNSFVSDGFDTFSVSIMLKEHKDSSVNQYQGVWTKFLFYLEDRHIEHGTIVLSTVFNFLAYHVTALNRKYRTIAAYRCALRHPLKYRLGLDLDSPESDSFMRGLFNYVPPVRRAPMPEWTLSVLLRYLKEGPFEPLESVSWELLTQKTLALLLLASGRRISELANISRSFERVGNRVSLLWIPGFRAKYHSRKFSPDHPSILTLDSRVGSDLLLCPVRAWWTFLGRRPSVSNSRDNRCFWSLSQGSLSYLFVKLVKSALRFAGRSDKVRIGPHQMRKLAASYSRNFLGGSAEKDSLLMKRMGCSSLTVLQKVYFNDVPCVDFPCVVPLGTVPVS